MVTQKQIQSWIPTAEYIFVKHMLFDNEKSGAETDYAENIDTVGSAGLVSTTGIDGGTNQVACAAPNENKSPTDITNLVANLKSLPPVYIGSPQKILKLRAELVKKTHSHQVECDDPYTSIMEMIHGDNGDAILIQQKLLPAGEQADIDFCHYFWHELGHYFAIHNECPGNDLHRFCDPELSDEREKQAGYWFWSEFIAEAISNYVDEKHCRIDNAAFYHPELITWEPTQWEGLSYRLSYLLNMTFSYHDYTLDESALAMYFATLLTDDATKHYIKAAENAELKTYNWDTLETETMAPGSIDPTCISDISELYQKPLLDLKALLEEQLKKEKFWEINEEFLAEIGNCIIQLTNAKVRLLAAELGNVMTEDNTPESLL